MFAMIRYDFLVALNKSIFSQSILFSHVCYYLDIYSDIFQQFSKTNWTLRQKSCSGIGARQILNSMRRQCHYELLLTFIIAMN